MIRSTSHACPACGAGLALHRLTYPYLESGMSNVYVSGVQVAKCAACGHEEARLTRLTQLHRAIAQALAASPSRLTGEQVRFLRKHLGLSGEQLGHFLHTDRSKVSKWESGQDPIGPASERLLRLLVASLDADLRPGIEDVARHLPSILDEPGSGWTLHVDARTLRVKFQPVPRAA